MVCTTFQARDKPQPIFFDLKINTEAGEHPVRVGAVVVVDDVTRVDAQCAARVAVVGRTQP